MTENAKNVAIGILVTVAILLVSWVLIFLHPSLGDSGKTLRVRFPNVDKINTGTRITYAGKPVGEVKDVDMIANARSQDQNSNTTIYPYEVTLSLDSRVDVYDCDEISVKTEGLMGERSITITPKRATQGIPAKLFDNGDLTYATNCNAMEDTISTFNSVVKKADRTLDEVLNIFAQNEVNFQKTLLSAEILSEELKKLVEKANNIDVIGGVKKLTDKIEVTATQVENSFKKLENSKLVENIIETSNSIAKTSQEFNNILAFIKKDEIEEIIENTVAATRNTRDFSEDLANSWENIQVALNNISKLTDNFSEFVASSQNSLKNIQTVTEKIANGDGSLGKLIVQNDLYLKANTILAKVDVLMNDVNNYGPLFHLNKTWQRERSRRMSELAKLQTPAEFRTYLEAELQKVTLAISRVSMAIEKAENGENGANTSEVKKEFANTYADLLSQMEELSNNLKLIGDQQNQAIADLSEQK